ncbi:hypothetical protein [Okeania sp. SIO2B9]|uniref:hypothetical protein n=1 Tax=Okeania sp. SIO2B9 TaxID=2607782 RepID=UPI00142BBE11|nr:hypothetical protein [Okeania sp. SIO2B9]NES90107.1 hypothetical protein [Okeania sp. SIO2B9]
MMIYNASKMLALIVLTNLAVAIFLRLKSTFLQIYTGYLIPFIKMLAEDPRSPAGERRDECQSIRAVLQIIC